MAGSSDGVSSAIVQLSAMFPNLELEVRRCATNACYVLLLQFLQTVLSNHEESVEPAVHYLVAVLGESDVPVSEDIGGLPQIIMDGAEAESDNESPVGSVCIAIDDEDSSSEQCESMDGSSYRRECRESLPSYRDVEQHSSPPPSYDSLESCQPSADHFPPAAESTARSNSQPSTSFNSLANKMRRRQRKKKGYHSYDT